MWRQGGAAYPTIESRDRIDAHTPFVNVTVATYIGLYTYALDAISPECGTVKLQIYSEKSPEKPPVKVLSRKTVERVWSDFAAYRKAEGKSTTSQWPRRNTLSN